MVELMIRAVRVNGENIEYIDNVIVKNENCDLIKLKLLNEYKKINNLLKFYKEEGRIKTLTIPRDKKILVKTDREKSFARKTKTPFQIHLNELVFIKREINKNIRKINTLF